MVLLEFLCLTGGQPWGKAQSGQKFSAHSLPLSLPKSETCVKRLMTYAIVEFQYYSLELQENEEPVLWKLLIRTVFSWLCKFLRGCQHSQLTCPSQSVISGQPWKSPASPQPSAGSSPLREKSSLAIGLAVWFGALP